eukprot:g44393.t1
MRWVPSADNRADVLSKKIASPSLFKKGADRLSGHQSKCPMTLVISCRPPPKRNLQVWAAVQDDVTTGQRQHQAALKGKARKGSDQRSGKVQQKRSSLAPGDDAYGYCKQPVAPASRFCSSCGKPYEGKPQSQPASVEKWYRGPFHLKKPPATASREWKVQKLARSEYLYVLTAGTLANNDPCKISFKVKVLAIPDSTYEGVELPWWTVLVEVVNMRVSQAIKSGTKFALVQTDSQVDLERLKKVWDGKAKAKNKVFVEHLSVNDLLGYWRVDKKKKKEGHARRYVRILPEGGEGGLSKAYRSELGEIEIHKLWLGFIQFQLYTFEVLDSRFKH